MFSHALNKAYGDEMEVIALHPGVVATDSFRDYPKWFSGLLNWFLEKPDSASKKIFEVASAQDLKPGYYLQNEYKGPVSQFVDQDQSAALYEFSRQYSLS